MPIEEDEYELVPLSPLRRMEKRMERIEKMGTANDMIKELVDVVKTNQQIVDDIVKINSDIISKITDLTGAVNQTLAKMEDFINRIEITGTVEERSAASTAIAPAETPEPSDVEKRIERLEKRINTLLLTTVAKSKRFSPQKPPTKPVPQF